MSRRESIADAITAIEPLNRATTNLIMARNSAPQIETAAAFNLGFWVRNTVDLNL